MERLARENGYPSVVVAYAKLDGDDVDDILAQQATSPLVRGIRHKAAQVSFPSEASRDAPGSMDDDRWRASR
ncbi:hypothetical protein [Bradyrhizobium tunisiense]|uniref:hypothetical protein n=1 Tax=Bradyrhizobium tunisiense TaxID=3278709 RepID=UPI0035E1F41B